MTGNDTVHITLSSDQWNDVYRILQGDHGWKPHLRILEKHGKCKRTTIPFLIHQVWPMSATILQVNQELADAIREQLSISIAVSF